MILAALIEEFTRRFQYEKRARACLWFDEKREFDAILPKLGQLLASVQPAPFSLLQYDQAFASGQKLSLGEPFTGLYCRTLQPVPGRPTRRASSCGASRRDASGPQRQKQRSNSVPAVLP